jgi:asparagine synthase (glutamine-hydrolysing)
MTQFLALIWDDREAESLASAARVRQNVCSRPDWSTLTDHTGLAVYVHHPQGSTHGSIALRPDVGTILGTLFKRATGSDRSVERTRSFGERETADIVSTEGRSLIDTHWGSYLLFLRRPEKHHINVLRGAAATLPCYYLTHDRCTLLASNVADFLWACGPRLSINWDCIRAQATAGDYLTHETGLSQVATLISGECLEIEGGQAIHRAYWNPAHLLADPIPDFADATRLLYEETHRCVRAWASLHDAVLLLLSGGLDSSIVLSCLRRQPTSTRTVAVNFYSEGAGDERCFARDMAAHTDTPLEEIPSNLNIDLRDFVQCALTSDPVQNFTAFDVEPVMREQARRCNATVIFTGEAGDDVFGHAPSPEALTELLQHPAQVHRFFGASLDFAELTRLCVWRSMYLAYRHLKWFRHTRTWSVYRRRKLAGQSQEGSLVSHTAIHAYEDMIGRFIHPWFKDAQELPLGKAMLIYSIIEATSSVSHSPFSQPGDVPMMSPLISQPLLEVALRIPSHLHFSGAENGAVARAAFRSALSPLVLNRGTAKGAPASWARRLLDHNSDFLRELLLEGMLVQRGILDPTKIQALLSCDLSRTRVGMAELIRQVYIELWLRRWVAHGARL